MKPLQTSEIRHKFIEFFRARQHTFVPSASTVPVDDKTILFTVAGMAQFKTLFTGQEKKSYVRATNSQKCIRVADLDDVGKDGRHLTMFEMLGSWSFGDYYKKDAISWAYEFIKNEIKLNLSNLWISVHHSDSESAEIWNSVGIPSERIVSLGDKDNFWAAGPTGPCGPCTEMYYDQGKHVGSCAELNLICKGPGCECDRFLEFWNLVFMQFQRDEFGKLNDLPMKSVDTGMGLERLASLIQQKTNVFETDVFEVLRQNILAKARAFNHDLPHTLCELTPEQKECTNVIADHMRLLCFTIADGAHFSNEGRGYVLRRVLRRAVRFADKLCPNWDVHHHSHNENVTSFLAQLVHPLVEHMGDFFPELVEHQSRIKEALIREENQFRKTLKSGLNKFFEFLNLAKNKNRHTLTGEQIFILHDTFGFPADLTKILCAEHHFQADLSGYDAFMRLQKEKSRADAKFYKFSEDSSAWVNFNPAHQKHDTNFNGYFLQPNYTKNGSDYFQKFLTFSEVTKMRQLKNGSFELVIQNTPFYPEGGGQVSDKGYIECINGEEVFTFELLDVKRTPSCISHILHLENWDAENESPTHNLNKIIHKGTIIACYVNLSFRHDVAKNHTATHLLHKALKIVLGDSVRQAGSLVKNDLLRFDFSHPAALTKENIEYVENLVNQEILKNKIVNTHTNVPLQEAKNMGAAAMFDEKYEDTVRVLQIENFSLELCGGTHVKYTGDIGQFKILSENGVTSGVRRIEAVTGFYALDYVRHTDDILDTISTGLKCARSDVLSKIAQLKELNKSQAKEILDLQNRLVDLRLFELFGSQNETKYELKIISTFIPECSLKELELLCDKIKAKPFHIAFLAASISDKVHFIAGMHPHILKDPRYKHLHLGKFMLTICEKLNGKGGGKPDFARGSGQLIGEIGEIMKDAKARLEQGKVGS